MKPFIGGSGSATRLRVSFFVLVAVVAALWLAGPASAELFILIDGAHAGDFVATSKGVPDVSANGNGLVHASGTISLPTDGCAGLHFDGMIEGSPNPVGGCGQGHVVVASGNLILVQIGDAIDDEQPLTTEPHPGSRQSLRKRAVTELRRISETLKEKFGAGEITKSTFDKLNNLLEKAIALDRAVINDPKLERLLKAALEAKHAFVRALPSTLTETDVPQSSVTDLGAGAGTDVTNGGAVLGNRVNPSTSLVAPFTWKGGLSTLFPTPAGVGAIGRTLNANGLVGGYAGASGGQSAAVWDGSKFIVLDGLSATIGKGNAVYKCNNGKPAICVGVSDLLGGSEQATEWIVPEAVFEAFGAAPAPIPVGVFPGASGAFAINNKGIFGGSFFESGSTGPYSPYIASTQTKKELFLWKPTGGSGVVLGLNDLTIAGGSITDASGTRAALWWGAEHSTLGPATTPSTIRGVNRLGWAVGDLGMPGNTRAALFLGRRTIDLSNRVPGYTLVRGDAINDKGWILADGRNAQGQLHAFLLRPKRRRK